MSAHGKKFLADIEANKLTIEELKAIYEILDQMERGDIVRIAMAKIRWHVAASRNEL